MATVKTYDPASYDLAEHFLQDEPCRKDPELYKKHCHSLALEIQQAVEDWFFAALSEDEAIFSAIGLLLAHGYAITPPRFQHLDSKSAPGVETQKVAVTSGDR